MDLIALWNFNILKICVELNTLDVCVVYGVCCLSRYLKINSWQHHTVLKSPKHKTLKRVHTLC